MKFSKFVVKYRFILFAIFIVVLAFSIVAFFGVKINSDIISYLPDDMTMTDGLNFMRENFDMEGDAIIAVENISEDKLGEYVKEMEGYDGVKQGGVIWIGTFKNFMPGMPSDVTEEILKNPDVIKMFKPKDNTFLVMLQLNVPTSSNEAMAILDKIETLFENESSAINGSTQLTKEIFDSTIGEIWKYLVVALLVVVIILILTTTSFIEPLILMLTLGISIIINMGTNIILPEVSVITFAASSILQLGLSMDYAIFLMHAFYEEREKCLDDEEAMRRAIPKTFSTILSAGLTTVGGFLALFFMKFKMGGDLGIVLAKGVFLSLVTVILLQPCLILICRKLLNKTRHRIFIPRFNRVASASIRHRKLIIVIALLAFIPAIIGQSNIQYSYMKLEKDGVQKTEIELVAENMGNSVIVVAPIATPEKHQEYIKTLKTHQEIIAINGIYSIVPKDMAKLIPILLNSEEGKEQLKGFVNNGYTMYSIMLSTPVESKETRTLLKSISQITVDFFEDEPIEEGFKTFYITGMAQAVSDFADITPTDFTIVTLVSLLLILIILIFTLRSIKLSVVLIAVVELGIFINLAISSFIGQEINFMAYIIISSIQLGSTIDYAILYTINFKNFSKTMPVKQAGYEALVKSGLSIVTSASIIAGACLSVYFVCTNRIVGEVTMLIARGAIISMFLCLIVLPAVIVSVSSNKLRFNRKQKKRLIELQKDDVRNLDASTKETPN